MLNISFLSPLFFIGLAAIALPIIAHLISRKSGIRKSFPAVSFLISSQGDLATRSRIKDIILLLLRALIIVLIVLLFAKPAVFSFSKNVDNTPKSIAIIVDNSFSMGYEDNFKNALEIANDIIDTTSDGSFTLIAPLVPNDQNDTPGAQEKSALKRTLKNIELSNTYTNNQVRLQDIYTNLQKTPHDKKEVILITDFQKNGWENEQFDAPWLELIDISTNPEPGNHAVANININYLNELISIEPEISNFSKDKVSNLLTDINLNKEKIKEYIDIEPASSTEFDVRFTVNQQKNGDGRVSTSNDKLKVDDTRYFIADGQDEASKILIVDGDPREDSRLSETYFLARALETISEISGTQINVLDNDGLLYEDISKYSLIYLANVGEITPRIAKELEQFVQNGGTAVIFLGNGIRASTYNTLFKDILPAELKNVYDDNVTITSNESTIFSKEVSNKINQINIEKLFEVTPYPESEILLNTSGHSPFLVKKDYGSGNVFIFTSTADTSWNNFSITPVFVPIIKKIHDIPNIERNRTRHFYVGENVKLEVNADTGTTVVDPSAKEHKMSSKSETFHLTQVPGIYEVLAGEDSYRFAVNVDPKESNLEKIAPRSLEQEPGVKGDFVKVFKEIWRYFLWGVIALFVSESAFRAIFS